MNNYNQSNDSKLSENQGSTELHEPNISQLKKIIKEILQLTKSSDVVAFENVSHAECFRDLRATCQKYLNEWPAEVEEWSDEQINDAIRTLTDGLELAENAVIKGQIDFSSSSVLAQSDLRCIDDEKIPAEKWPNYSAQRRRQSQNDHVYERTKNEFPVIVPSSYSCIKCPSNDHTTSKCPRRDIRCLKCQKEGHLAETCRWQICAYCGLYGHGRKICESKKRLCGNCGSSKHVKLHCKSSRLYCRLCGGEHKMIYCREYDGSCYTHCGRHLYKHCPDRRRTSK